MHQCLEDLKELLRTEMSDAQFNQIVQWNREIILQAQARRNVVEVMYAQFLSDRTNTRLYGQIIHKLRADMQATKDINLERYNQLKAVRNKLYQHKPLGYIPPGRSERDWEV